MVVEALLFLSGCFKQAIDMLGSVMMYGTVSVFSFFFGLYVVQNIMHFIIDKIMGVGGKVLRGIDKRAQAESLAREKESERLLKEKANEEKRIQRQNERVERSLNRQRSRAALAEHKQLIRDMEYNKKLDRRAEEKRQRAYEASGRAIDRQRSRAAYREELKKHKKGRRG